MRTENLEFYNEIKNEVKSLMKLHNVRVNRRNCGIDDICEYIIDAVENDTYAVSNIRKTFRQLMEDVNENNGTKFLLKN